MRHAISCLLPAILAITAPAAVAADLVVLRYGEVLANPVPGQPATATTALLEHLELLADSGHTPVTLDAVLAGGGAMPERAVLLTFDGGYASFATDVAPLLAVAGVPAVVGVSTGWLDGAATPPDDRPRLDWDGLRRLTAAPSLIAVASHGHELWRELTATSYGDVGPAATTRDVASSEDEAARRDRVSRDLRHSAERLAAELGRQVRAVSWPYGAWDRAALDAARGAGLDLALALRPVLDPGRDRGDGVLRRLDMGPGVDAAALQWALHPPSPRSTVRRSVTVDLGWFAGDPDGPGARVDRVAARLATLGTTAVVLRLPATGPGADATGVVELAAHLTARLRRESSERPILVDLRTAGADAPIEGLLGRLRADGVVLAQPPDDGRRSAILGAVPDAVVAVVSPSPGRGAQPLAPGVGVVLFERRNRDGSVDGPPALPAGVAAALVLTGDGSDDPEGLARRLRHLSAAGWRWIGLDAGLSATVLEGPYHPATAELSEARRPRETSAR